MLKEDSCGIDVGASEFVVQLRREGQVKRGVFPNTPAGHRSVCRFVAKAGHRVRVCLESTGLYGLDLALELDKSRGVEVMVANPRAVRRFAQALMKRGKSDQIDADVLEQFAARMPFERWTAPSAAALELRAISRRIKALCVASTAEKNRLHAAKASQTTPAVVRRDIQHTIARHRSSITLLKAEALKLIARQPQLDSRLRWMISTRGIAKTSAIQILGELSVLSPDLDGRQWVAHAGLDPRLESSGTSVQKKPRISKTGNKYLRCALFMPALVARHKNPHFKAFADHLQANGKQPLQVIVAVMRKLLLAIYGMFKNQQPFIGEKIFTLK